MEDLTRFGELSRPWFRALVEVKDAVFRPAGTLQLHALSRLLPPGDARKFTRTIGAISPPSGSSGARWNASQL